jgi:hypothetical protein
MKVLAKEGSMELKQKVQRAKSKLKSLVKMGLRAPKKNEEHEPGAEKEVLKKIEEREPGAEIDSGSATQKAAGAMLCSTPTPLSMVDLARKKTDGEEKVVPSSSVAPSGPGLEGPPALLIGVKAGDTEPGSRTTSPPEPAPLTLKPVPYMDEREKRAQKNKEKAMRALNFHLGAGDGDDIEDDDDGNEEDENTISPAMLENFMAACKQQQVIVDKIQALQRQNKILRSQVKSMGGEPHV